MCILFRRKKKEKVELWETPLYNVGHEETNLLLKINIYRNANKLPSLYENGYLLTLADQRTVFWKKNGYDHEDNLHEFFPGHAKPYLDSGMFVKIQELANYGIMGDFESFRNSPKHNPHLLGDYKYIAVSMLDKYCCVILGK